MDQTEEQLAELIEQPSTHQKVVGSFRGAYSLGISQNEEGRWILMLELAEQGRDETRHIVLNGDVVEVKVLRNWRSPLPLTELRCCSSEATLLRLS